MPSITAKACPAFFAAASAWCSCGAQNGTLLVDDDFLVLVNSWSEPVGFVLPRTRPSAQWHAEIGSYDPAAPAQPPARSAGDQVTVGPRSVAVLRAPRPQ